jgi:hypothetical protein
MSELTKLFAEFVEAQEEGRNPSANDYVARAGGEGARLRAMLDSIAASRAARKAATKRILDHTLLTISKYGHVPAASTASFGVLVAEAEERVRRRDRCSRSKIAEDIARAADVSPVLHAKFQGYYHQLKTGQMDPRLTTPRLLSAISGVLGVAISELLAAAASYREPPREAVLQFTRTTGEEAPPPMTTGQRTCATEQDFVDRMFFGDAPDA